MYIFQCSMASPASQTNLSECSDTTVNSDDTNRHCRRNASVTDLENTRMDRIGKIAPDGDVAIHSDTGDLEVIHVKRKGRGSNRRKSVQKRKTSSVELIDQWPGSVSLTSPQTPESGYRSVVDRGSPCCKSLNDSEIFMDERCEGLCHQDRSLPQVAPPGSEVSARSQPLKGVDRVPALTSFQTLFSADMNWSVSETIRPAHCDVSEGSSRLSTTDSHVDVSSANTTEADNGLLTTETQVVSRETHQTTRDSSRSSSKPVEIGSCDSNAPVPLVNGIDACSVESGCEQGNSDRCQESRPVRELSIYDDCPDASAKNYGICGDSTSDKDADSVSDAMNDSAYSEPKDVQTDVTSVSSLTYDKGGCNNNKEMLTEGCPPGVPDDSVIHQNEHK